MKAKLDFDISHLFQIILMVFPFFIFLILYIACSFQLFTNNVPIEQSLSLVFIIGCLLFLLGKGYEHFWFFTWLGAVLYFAVLYIPFSDSLPLWVFNNLTARYHARFYRTPVSYLLPLFNLILFTFLFFKLKIKSKKIFLMIFTYYYFFSLFQSITYFFGEGIGSPDLFLRYIIPTTAASILFLIVFHLFKSTMVFITSFLLFLLLQFLFFNLPIYNFFQLFGHELIFFFNNFIVQSDLIIFIPFYFIIRYLESRKEKIPIT